MVNFLTKLVFFFKKPTAIIVTGRGSAYATEAIFQVLKEYFLSADSKKDKLKKGQRLKKIPKDKNLSLFDPINNNILILESGMKEIGDFGFFVKESKFPILIVTHIGDIPSGSDFFAGEKSKIEKILDLIKTLPKRCNLILNFDDETVREIKDQTDLNSLTFGFQERADCQATDVKLNTGTNFKLNFKGNTVPVWLDYLFGKEQIYSALSTISVGILLDLNLVKISQALKAYQSLPGKMRMIKGVKDSFILDSSKSASVFSVTEALEILGKIDTEKFQLSPRFPRRIAVLGDILEIGKYAIEAHEAIGERVVSNVDLLLTIGSRAKFIAQGAISKGMPEEKVFQFDQAEKAGPVLQKEIREGDLVLVSGSIETKMQKIVEEIQAF